MSIMEYTQSISTALPCSRITSRRPLDLSSNSPFDSHTAHPATIHSYTNLGHIQSSHRLVSPIYDNTQSTFSLRSTLPTQNEQLSTPEDQSNDYTRERSEYFISSNQQFSTLRPVISAQPHHSQIASPPLRLDLNNSFPPSTYTSNGQFRHIDQLLSKYETSPKSNVDMNITSDLLNSKMVSPSTVSRSPDKTSPTIMLSPDKTQVKSSHDFDRVNYERNQYHNFPPTKRFIRSLSQSPSGDRNSDDIEHLTISTSTQRAELTINNQSETRSINDDDCHSTREEDEESNSIINETDKAKIYSPSFLSMAVPHPSRILPYFTQIPSSPYTSSPSEIFSSNLFPISFMTSPMMPKLSTDHVGNTLKRRHSTNNPIIVDSSIPFTTYLQNLTLTLQQSAAAKAKHITSLERLSSSSELSIQDNNAAAFAADQGVENESEPEESDQITQLRQTYNCGETHTDVINNENDENIDDDQEEVNEDGEKVEDDRDLNVSENGDRTNHIAITHNTKKRKSPLSLERSLAINEAYNDNTAIEIGARKRLFSDTTMPLSSPLMMSLAMGMSANASPVINSIPFREPHLFTSLYNHHQGLDQQHQQQQLHQHHHNHSHHEQQQQLPLQSHQPYPIVAPHHGLNQLNFHSLTNSRSPKDGAPNLPHVMQFPSIFSKMFPPYVPPSTVGHNFPLSSSLPANVQSLSELGHVPTRLNSMYPPPFLNLGNVSMRRASADKPPPVKKYKCDVCQKAFSRSNTLVTHKRIHTGDKPFKCEICGRAFRQPGNLTRHRLTHTTHKPYVCHVCNKAFNRASNLNTHIRTHSSLRQLGHFGCPATQLNPKGFAMKHPMASHIDNHRQHHGERLFKCDSCGRGFAHSSTLTSHRLTHLTPDLDQKHTTH